MPSTAASGRFVPLPPIFLNDPRNMLDWTVHAGPMRRRQAEGAERAPAEPIEVPRWLDEVRAMRGRVLHAGGRRPQFFDAATQRCYDAQPHDLQAWHIVARLNGQIVGCVRCAPLGTSDSPLAAILGHEQLNQIVASLGATPEECSEVSRWTVDPECGMIGLGYDLIAAVWAFLADSGFRFGLAAAGTAGKQDRILHQLGLRYLEGVEDRWSATFDDTLRFMYAPFEQPVEKLEPGLADMRQRLQQATD